MTPITRVLGESGEVLHDCIDAGCSVSWDGVALRDLTPQDLHADDATRPGNIKPVARGEKVPGAGDEIDSAYDVRGSTAKLKLRED